MKTIDKINVLYEVGVFNEEQAKAMAIILAKFESNVIYLQQISIQADRATSAFSDLFEILDVMNQNCSIEYSDSQINGWYGNWHSFDKNAESRLEELTVLQSSRERWFFQHEFDELQMLRNLQVKSEAAKLAEKDESKKPVN